VYELTTAINLWAVPTTMANNPCHGFSVIAGINDTGGDKFLTRDNNISDKFIAGVNNTGEHLSPVMTPVNYYRVDHDTGDK
jgi:hypothetical protein